MKLWIALFMAAELIGTLSLMSYVRRGNEPKTAQVVIQMPSGVAGVTGPTGPAPKAEPTTVESLEVEDADTLRLSGEVGENAVDLANKILDLPASDKPMYLLINSPGGSVLDGAALLSAMEASKRPIYTVCEQLCASMAAVIHQYGVKRYMSNRAILMFHDAAGGAQGFIPHMKSQIDMIDAYFHDMDDYIAKRSSQDPEAFKLKAGALNIWAKSDVALSQHYSDGTVALHISGRAAPMSIFFIHNKQSLDWKSQAE